MREIKFRCWDGIQMVYDINLEDGEFAYPNTQRSGGSAFEGCPVKYDVQQFTGLKDKNGIEIFESDVVRWETRNKKQVGRVYWNTGKARFDIEWGGNRIDYGEPDLDSNIIEVIGNIYENPDLLSQPNGEKK